VSAPRLLLLRPALRRGRRLCGYMTDYSGAVSPAGFVFPPLELLWVAALARAAGVEVELVDAAAARIGPRRAVKAAASSGASHVLVATPIGDLAEQVPDLLTRLRAARPGIRIAVFGPEVSSAPRSLLDRGLADAAIVGEPDLPTAAWLRDEAADGLVRPGDAGPWGPARVDDLDALPHPPRDLLRKGLYYAPFSHTGPYAAVQGSRGCAYGLCRFCPSSLWRPPGEVARHSPGWVAGDVRRVAAAGYREVFFRDQVFTADRAWALQLCRELEASGASLPWRCMTRVDAVDTEVLERMRAAGCYQVSMGFESHEQAALDAVHKGFDLDEAFRAAGLVQQAGLELVGNFMVGLSGSTDDALALAGGFARQLGCDYAQFNLVEAVPTDEGPAAAGPGDPARLARFERRAYLDFYLRPQFLWRRRGALVRPPILWANLRAGWNLVRPGR